MRPSSSRPGVAFHGGKREVRNVGVVDFVLHLHLLGQRAQAGAEDDAGFGLKVLGVGLDVGGGCLDLLQHKYELGKIS